MIKAAGSKKAARADADIWYEKGRRNRRVNEIMNATHRFTPGKIYSFEYRDPITPNIPWYDMHPIVLALDSHNNNDMGVNLNLLPIRIKENLLDDLYDALSSQITSAKGRNAIEDGRIRVTYNGIKAYLDRYGFGFAIRQYKPNRKRAQAVISYDSWPKIALANLIELNGASIRMVRAMHSAYIRNMNI